MIVSDVTDADNPKDRTYSEHFACVKCGTSLPEIEPRTFSFNSPHGACPTCTGLGTLQEFDPELILDEDLSLADGAVIAWRRSNDDDSDGYYGGLLKAACRQFAIPFNAPVREFSSKQRDIILYGPPRKQDKVKIEYRNSSGEMRYYETGFSGVIPNLQRRYAETTSEYIRSKLEEYMSMRPCPTCQGQRLRPEALAVTIDDRNIHEMTSLPVEESLVWVKRLAGPRPGDTGRSARQRLSHAGAAGRQPALPARTRHRPAGAQRDRRSSAIHGQRGAGLSDAQPHRGDALRRRITAHPPGDADRQPA